MVNHVPSSHLRKAVFLTAFLMFTLYSRVNAEMIRLTSGQIITGKIIERNSDMIKIDTGIGIAITYFLDEIDLIDIEEDHPVEILEPVEVFEPTKIEADFQDEEPVTTKLTVEPIKDIMVIEEQNRSKEMPSPFGPTIREMESIPAVGKHAVDDLNSLLIKRQDGKTTSSSEDLTFKEFQRFMTQYYNRFLVKLKAMNEEFKKRMDDEYISFIKEQLDQIPINVRHDIFIAFCIAMPILYFLFCFPVMKIAKILECKQRWLIWIPIVQIFYFIYMAKKSLWWGLWLLLPFINIIVLIVLFASVLKELNMSSRMAIFIIVPGINILLLWYLSFKKPKIEFHESF